DGPRAERRGGVADAETGRLGDKAIKARERGGRCNVLGSDGVATEWSADAKGCPVFAVCCPKRPSNDFLDSTDYAADTSFTATWERVSLFLSLALTVTQFA